MSATPPLGTLVIQNIDALGPNAVVGIDTQFFTVQHFLKGIKSIPAGPHLLHYSASVDDGASMRYAWWFQCADGDVLSVRWAEEEAFFEAYDASLSDLGDIYPFMVSYPEKPDKWRVLSEFLDAEALEEYLPRREQAVTTATPSAEENMVLLEVLKRQKSDIELSDQSQDELKYTIIQSQKRRPDTVGEQLTRDSLDRSWYLAEVFGHDMELLLAEIQLSFIHFIVLCNLCSYTQWMNLVGLVSNSKNYFSSHRSVAYKVLSILRIQLDTLPPDYVLGTSSLQVVEVARLETMLSQLNDIFHGEQQWHELLEIAHKKAPFEACLRKHR
ncbi:hypothetical protein JCM33374_g6585 [Metschnikowia sp. JCM 33374]|nr:hypothetical protein JCM33374_g6585 [Metschnikowia sp. JCM 33374]